MLLFPIKFLENNYNQLVNVSMQKIPEEVSNSYSLRLNTDPIKLLEFLDISYEKITLQQ